MSAEEAETAQHVPILMRGQQLTQEQERDDLVRRIGLRWKVKATGRGGALLVSSVHSHLPQAQ